MKTRALDFHARPLRWTAFRSFQLDKANLNNIMYIYVEKSRVRVRFHWSFFSAVASSNLTASPLHCSSSSLLLCFAFPFAPIIRVKILQKYRYQMVTRVWSHLALAGAGNTVPTTITFVTILYFFLYFSPGVYLFIWLVK